MWQLKAGRGSVAGLHDIGTRGVQKVGLCGFFVRGVVSNDDTLCY